MRTDRKKWIFLFGVGAAVILAAALSLFYGSTRIPAEQVLQALENPELTNHQHLVVLELRIPRTIGCIPVSYTPLCYSFESPKVFDKLLLPKDDSLRKAIVISNPLGEDFSIMRTISLNGMLTSLGTNYKRRNKDVRLYELGNIYIPKELPLKELPEERMMSVSYTHLKCLLPIPARP